MICEFHQSLLSHIFATRCTHLDLVGVDLGRHVGLVSEDR